MIKCPSYLLLLWLASGCWGQDQVPPPSPCPDVFSYQNDGYGGWYGLVTILPPATFSEARLNLKMFVSNYFLDKGIGRVDVFGGVPEIQEISKSAHRGARRRIKFQVFFPPVRTIPHIKEILINGVLFCADKRDYGAGGNIELKYVVLTGLKVPSVSGTEFSILPPRVRDQDPGTGTVANPQSNYNVNTPPFYTKWSYMSETHLGYVPSGLQSHSPPIFTGANNDRKNVAYGNSYRQPQPNLRPNIEHPNNNNKQGVQVQANSPLALAKETTTNEKSPKKTSITIETDNHSSVQRIEITGPNNSTIVHVK